MHFNNILIGLFLKLWAEENYKNNVTVQKYVTHCPRFHFSDGHSMRLAVILPVEIVLVHIGEAQRRISQLFYHRLWVFGIQHLI